MKIFIVRGAFLNPFELQNYAPLKEKHDIKAVSSKHPISDKIDFSLIKLWSPTDIPKIPFKFPILNRLFTDAHVLFGLEKVIKGADIVHVAETYYAYTHQAVMAKRRGLVKKIVSTVWETIPHNNEGIKGRERIKRLARENIDHFIAVTELAKKALVQEGVSEKIISAEKKNKRALTILCIARLVPEKGVEDLMSAFLEIAKKNIHVHLNFIGDGPLKGDLSGYKNVSVRQVPYGLMAQEYQSADIFCLPSRSAKTWEEQYGMVLVEAMACGLPIVTTSTGAISEVCGDAALYTKSSDPQGLKDNLEILLKDAKLREKLGKIGRQRALNHFDRFKISKKINAVYQNLLKH
ncbi:MAG: hypothetical protein UW58_C0008G0027 [Candidatus Collierbacteria bacterium GW2011_GWC2_44_30]|nr:MAG: hypothetical protein UW58_C0008G0027 [Candidatus Collierbacteria bacterium GW2011_GWC2_44_30]